LTAELAAPCAIEIEFDERFREKSAAGGGGGGMTEDEPPPQLAHINASERGTTAGTL
jgi:hypothetical protein